ncbi:GTP cyclohydrolase, FolE2/MptA family [Alishewanella longhuensis]
MTVDISEQLELGITPLILLAEQSLATPVQTAVKRADEQAFAKLNGQNLMFVEDAARRLAQAIGAQFPIFSIEVKHLESLHPHDAVARVDSGRRR